MNKGKAFEKRFLQDWLKIPGAFALRLPDQQSGYYGTSTNPCDFICYSYPNMFLLELKSHGGKSFPLSAFKQYEKLVGYDGIDGVKIGVILWLYECDKVIYIPIKTFKKIIEDGKKSFSIKNLETKEYDCFELPSTKLRTFMTTDYSFLINLAKSDIV